MAEINFDKLPSATERQHVEKTGARFDIKEISPRIVKDVEKYLADNITRLDSGKRVQYVTQECGSAEAAQEWLRQMSRYAKYRPDGAITVRVSNRKAVKEGKDTAVDYAPKPLEDRTPKDKKA